MNDAKYIELDIHQATISAAVLDSTGKLVMEFIVETKAATILQFVHGLRGSVHVTLEERTCAAESLTRLPWVINTTFREMIYSRWCCIDRLSWQVLSVSDRLLPENKAILAQECAEIRDR
jgi:hypothetical protein